MSGEEEEDYGFEYSDEEEEEDDVDIENQYYNAKALLETDLDEALSAFEQVVQMETEKGEWGFKALKQIVKLQFRQGQFDQVLNRYKEMLTYIRSAVTRNYSEKSINSILEFVSSSQNMDVLEKLYETTLQALEESKNERLWFKTNLKLGKLLFDTGEYVRLGKVLRDLHKSCQKEDGTDDLKKGTQLLEVYALEIQMYTETKNTKRLRALYEKALQVKSAIPHPLIMGIIRECGGKMLMGDKNFEQAKTDFYEAFKSYDEAGNTRRIQCLKYLVLANMLAGSEINPFDSPEAKPYINNPEIVAMTDLVGAYNLKDIIEFERILNIHSKSILEDPFIRLHIQDLLSSFRTQVLIKLIEPYTRVGLRYVSEQLNIPESELEALLVSLILDRKIKGRIDQANKVLELGDPDASDARYDSIQRWSEQVARLHAAVVGRLDA
eukprot:CAMPEP_0184708474 /NCGR_PEP_ID=MMETSP0313-20130426/37796_1 /TAXON_ID=2792 /ORGANISM="Porphyridium aerugineum, Strain SAG 1380-2" /LENGTH=437 /DNA_ID=CAMNT_0027170063 /DNA_START=84 /DNA_END=1397 /DNA_ORIENTATION=+